MTKLTLGAGSKIDDIIWDDELDKIVSKTGTGTFNVNGAKTFKQNEFQVPEAKMKMGFSGTGKIITTDLFTSDTLSGK